MKKEPQRFVFYVAIDTTQPEPNNIHALRMTRKSAKESIPLTAEGTASKAFKVRRAKGVLFET